MAGTELSAGVQMIRHNLSFQGAFCLVGNVHVCTHTYAHTRACTHAHTLHTQAHTHRVHAYTQLTAPWPVLSVDAALRCVHYVEAEDTALILHEQ